MTTEDNLVDNPFPTDEILKQQHSIYDNDKFREFKGSVEGSSSLILEIIKNVKPGADVTQIAAPTFTLLPISLLENFSDFACPETILNLASTKDALDRMITTVIWVLEGYILYTPQFGFYHYKPYNPIKGEQFHCKWEHQDSTSFFHSEQVSHHPPISACYLENKLKNIVHESTTQVKMKFWGNTSEMTMDGNYLVHVLNLKETYEITYPKISIRGIIWGTSTIERYGPQTVKCEKTGYICDIEYTKGYNVEGTIYHKSDKQQKLVTITGNLKGEVTIQYTDNKNNNNKTKKGKKTIVSIKSIKRTPKVVEDVYKQKPNESRRVWHNVTNYLYQGDYTCAQKSKNAVEEYQRKLRKSGQEGPDKPVLFCKTSTELDGVPIFEFKNKLKQAVKNDEEDEGDDIELD